MKSTGVVGNNNNNNAKEGDSRKKLVERRNNNLSEMFDSLKEKQAQGNSPWVSTGSYKQVTPTTTTTVQFSANKTPVVYSGSGLQERSNSKEKSSESKELDVGTENLNLDKRLDHNSSKAVKPRQNSDTIETDSESPDETTRRPVTRSLTQKKGSTATNPRLKQGSGKGANLHTALSSRRRPQEKNIFTFNEAEERSGSLHGISGPRLLKSTSKNSGKKVSTRVEPRRISFSGKRNSKKIRRDTDSDETQPASSKTQSHSGKVEKLHLKPSEIDRENLQPINGIRDEEQLHHSSQSKKVNQQEELSSPELPKDTSPLTGFWSGSWKNNLDPQYGAESPTLRMKATMKESFLNTSPKSIQEEQAIQSPVPDERRFVTKGFYNLRTLQKSKRGSSGVNAETDSSDDTDDLKESPIPNMESSPVMEEIDAKHRLSESSEDPEEDSGEEDQPISKGRRGAHMWTAGCNNTEISPSIIRQNKRFCQDGLGPTSPSQKGILESSELEQPSNQNNDDGMMSLKFTNLGNSKRKSLETRFQEQHERLKSTQDKFKEEVAHHLKECKSTLEDLEAFQAELMGNAKRQKTSHQKLLAQAEKEIETQLNDADRRITAIRKASYLFLIRNSLEGI
ncbi:hypothetical protein IFM89_005692 [Coptis chinensis]|uniref:Meiosis-specific protein ASY3-like coiled-coil domain-containing protein n=1 Tax=Coptis chinensis TaxID=261450 RepID=A0A835LLH9_9MAGN|nr:hypothetical protein IFM89_005692 [Coptis chinensis]